MILKDADDRSRDLAELERLQAIAPPEHKSRVKAEIKNLYAGMKGEREAAHFIGREIATSQKMILLNDIRLEIDGDYVQIDHLVIHRFHGAAWILETKNYGGRMVCDEHGDWTVWYGKNPVSIPSPVNQARRQRAMLLRWLEQEEFKAIHRIEPIVLVSPTSSINRTHLPKGAVVVKSDNFWPWWEEQAEQIGVMKAFGLMGRHLMKGMSHEHFIELGHRLVQAHVPQQVNWCAKLQLPELEARSAPAKGVPGSPKMAADKSVMKKNSEPQIETITTPHGTITIRQINDNCFAIRAEDNAEMIEVVKKACKGRARWNPRYKNWLVDEERFDEVMSLLPLHEVA